MSYNQDLVREFLLTLIHNYVPDGTEELSERETLLLSNFLFQPEVPIEIKQRVIILMSHLDSVTAFREMEKYAENPDDGLQLWANTALEECRMFMEMSLSEDVEGGEEVGVFMGGGLGGHKNSMRCYFMVLPMPGNEMTDELNALIEVSLKQTGKEIRVVVEDFFYSKNHLGFTALIPFDVAIAEFMETSIERCGAAGAQVYPHYYACNGEMPDEAEIPEIISTIMES